MNMYNDDYKNYKSERRKKRTIEIIAISMAVIIMFALYNFLTYRDIDYLKANSPEFLKKNGFTVSAYDGYEGDIFHGGYTWYHVTDNKGYLYNLCTGEWRGTIMIYNNKCLNAVQNSE